MSLSLKSKILILLSGISFLTGALLLYIAMSMFKADKIAYIFDSNTYLLQSISEHFRNEVSSTYEVANAYLARYRLVKKLSSEEQKYIGANSVLDGIKIFQPDPTGQQPRMIDSITKEESAASLPKEDISFYENVRKSDLKKQELSFKDGYFMLFETLELPEKLNVVLYFKSKAMDKFFGEDRNYLAYLINGSGEVFKKDDDHSLYFKSTDLDKIFPGQKIVNLLKLSVKEISSGSQDWLFSSNSLGLGNMYLMTLVNKNKAMSVVNQVLFKTALIFCMIIAVVIVLGLFSSIYLTERLTKLKEATQQVRDGNFDVKLKAAGKDEISDLTNNFNVMTEEIKRLVNETANKARMESELKTAQLVQSTLFPPNVAEYGNISLRGEYYSASECGGDWLFYYDSADSVTVVIADATGHGASAALLTSAARSSMALVQDMSLDVQNALRLLNKSLTAVSRENMMMTCFIAHIDKKTLQLTYSNASHEAPIVLRSKADGDPLKKKDLIFLNEHTAPRLGESAQSEFGITIFQLEPKDRVFFYTDGIPDIKNLDSESLGERGMIKLLLKAQNENMNNFEEFYQTFKSEIISYRSDTELVDDVTYCLAEVSA